MSRPAPIIKFFYRDEEQNPDYEQIDDCSRSSGFCNSTAVMTFTPLSSDPEHITCRVYYKQGKYTEVRAKSYVFAKPTVSLSVPESAIEGDKVELNCNGGGHPAPQKFYWSINNGPEVVTVDKKKIVKVERSQTTRKSQMIVSCRVEAQFDREIYSEQSTKSISVYWGPVASSAEPSTESVEIDEGETFTMSCSFDGFPAPEIRWVQFSSHVGVDKGTSANKVIKSVSGADTGDWVCTARNEKTGSTQKRKIKLLVRQRPVIYSEKVQNNDAAEKPFIKCEFMFGFNADEAFKRLSWSRLVKTADGEKREILPGLNDIRKIENQVVQTSVDAKYSNRFTDFNEGNDDTRVTALLQINDVEGDASKASYVCSVENTVGRTERTFTLNSNPLTAEIITILGAVIGGLFVLFIICVVCVFLRRRDVAAGTLRRKLTPDLIGAPQQLDTKIPPAFSHALSHREDAEINVSRSDLNQSNPSSRNWEKPSSTYSGPDDGYSTERNDCASAKTDFKSKQARRNPLELDNFESNSVCLSYVNENRAQSERFYSTLQPGQTMGKGFIRPHSATPYQQGLRHFDDMDHESSGTSSDTSNSNQPLLHESANVFLQQGTIQPRLTTRTISHV